MCGLVGIAGKLEYQDESLMKRLLIFDYFRGTDSTGLASLNRNTGETHVVKVASNPIDLFDMKKFDKALTGAVSSVFLGHNRATTIGKTNNTNAHPFEVDHIIGAHNGTLTQNSWRALEELIGEQTSVDSYALISAIAKVGIEETVKHLQGAWAITWIDTKEGTINFLRNKERPFWYAYTKDFSKIIWASQHPMIKAAVELTPSQFKKQEIFMDDEGYGYFSTEEDMLYTLDLAKMVAGGYKSKPKAKVKKLEGLPPVAAKVVSYSNYSSDYSFFGRNPKDDDNTSTKGKQMVSVPNPSGPYDTYLTKKGFDALSNQGCSWCHEPVYYNDTGVSVFLEDGVVLCPSCSENHQQDNKIYVHIN